MSNENLQSPEDEIVITDDPEVLLVMDWDKKQVVACDYKGKRIHPSDFNRQIFEAIDRLRHKAPLTFNDVMVEEG